MVSLFAINKEMGWGHFVSELWNCPRLKRLTFSSRLTSCWVFLSPGFGLSLQCNLVFPLQCLRWQSLVPSPPLQCPPFPPFIRRPGSRVTNYSERAEKVAWALPSGLPCCIIVSEIAGTQQPQAAGTTTAASASEPAIWLNKIQTVVMPEWMSGSYLLLLSRSCWAEQVWTSRELSWAQADEEYDFWLFTLCSLPSKDLQFSNWSSV